MSQSIATIVFVIGIAGLFVLDRNQARTAKALWIPVVWLLLAGSRPLSSWLQMAPPSSADLYLEGSPLDRAFFILLFVLGLIVLVNRRQQVGMILRMNGPILLFFVYCALSVLWSDYPEVAFKRWIKAVGDLEMVLIITTDSDPMAALKRVLARMGFLLLPLSVLFIKYYPDLGRSYNRWTWLPSWTGVTTNKNELGMVCLILGLGSLWRFIEAFRTEKSAGRTGPLVAHGALLVMTLWLFWMANSMTSLACFLLAAGLLTATSLSAWTRSHTHFLVVAALCGSVYALFLNPTGGLIESLGRDPTLTGRTEIWSVLPRFVPDSLLGTGYGSFWLGERLLQVRSIFPGNPLMEAHNGYLEVFLTLGWIGIFLLALVIVTGYRNVFRCESDTASLKLAYFVAAVVYNCTEAAFKELNLVWIFFLLVILAAPTDLVARVPMSVDAHPAGNFSEWEPQINHAFVRRYAS